MNLWQSDRMGIFYYPMEYLVAFDSVEAVVAFPVTKVVSQQRQRRLIFAIRLHTLLLDTLNSQK